MDLEEEAEGDGHVVWVVGMNGAAVGDRDLDECGISERVGVSGGGGVDSACSGGDCCAGGLSG